MNSGNFNLGMASLADTGQWLLVVEISATGISAVLKNVDYDDTPLVPLFSRVWEDRREDLLSNVEAAVYDNPRMLEDFATHVIINTRRALWVPEDLAPDEDFDENLFTRVYPAESMDICADFGKEEVCLHTLVPGLNAFLQRTLPGSRTSSHLSVLKAAFSEFDSHSSRPNTIYVNIREGEADVFLFSEGRFLCGTVHEWKEFPDLVYKALLVCHAYGVSPHSTSVVLACHDSLKEALDHQLSEFFPEIFFIENPEFEDLHGISFVSSLATGRSITLMSHQ